MLLSKIMLQLPDEVAGIVSGKIALRYSGPDIEAMKAVANASRKRSLEDFKAALATYPEELEKIRLSRSILESLYQSMLEQNLCRIIEPLSRRRFSSRVQRWKKALANDFGSQVSGDFGSGNGGSHHFEEAGRDSTYDDVLETINAMSRVVDRLYLSAQKLT
ncbi:26S proteasome non-ATPase regulatory subunit 11 [Caligus rogercresseyi]|uniref:26S proteasome non-ATPase regulatory subunit 11 n=1 Tax=Caligus rogercresseyi TaxID=217165 RepID=A0A7T8GKY6_CALRO|nr:26S proteasome non-ATPase regulatory subunit 11 [Caligus rogercresseyi]